MNITVLGRARYPSPLQRWVDDRERIPATIVRNAGARRQDGSVFELAGARAKLFFNPRETRAGIVTCGGLCPGLNDVIRAIVLSLRHHYGVRKVYGFRYGYEGLVRRHGHEPLQLTAEGVNRINEIGGSILGSSRGPQDPAEMVERRLNEIAPRAALHACLE